MSSNPAETTSEEFDERHMGLAAEEGEAYQRSLRHVIDVVAHTGATTREGDYVVGFAQEEAEGLYRRTDDGAFEWTEPDEADNCHLEVAVADAVDGRFVPGLDVSATLTAPDGGEIGPVDLPFLWHPGLYRYGENFRVPGDGTYAVRVHVEPPAFRRHDRENGDRYGDPIDVVFEDVDLKTGRSERSSASGATG